MPDIVYSPPSIRKNGWVHHSRHGWGRVVETGQDTIRVRFRHVLPFMRLGHQTFTKLHTISHEPRSEHEQSHRPQELIITTAVDTVSKRTDLWTDGGWLPDFDRVCELLETNTDTTSNHYYNIVNKSWETGVTSSFLTVNNLVSSDDIVEFIVCLANEAFGKEFHDWDQKMRPQEALLHINAFLEDPILTLCRSSRGRTLNHSLGDIIILSGINEDRHQICIMTDKLTAAANTHLLRLYGDTVHTLLEKRKCDLADAKARKNPSS